jgi:hypothetical protein
MVHVCYWQYDHASDKAVSACFGFVSDRVPPMFSVKATSLVWIGTPHSEQTTSGFSDFPQVV